MGIGAVGSLVVRESASRPEGLGSLPDAPKYPFPPHTSTLVARARQNSGSEILVDGCSINHGCRGLENISLPYSPCLNCGDGDKWCCHLSCRSPTCLGLWQLSFLPFGKDTPTTTISVKIGFV
ncbi:hypothetical protein TNCV_945431 [Trichonephila clavipes]|nr:hypothetical protein TNCV_945431 [Trichonephila clavipes]